MALHGGTTKGEHGRQGEKDIRDDSADLIEQVKGRQEDETHFSRQTPAIFSRKLGQQPMPPTQTLDVRNGMSVNPAHHGLLSSMVRNREVGGEVVISLKWG
jgi:hypothetical protein